MKRKRKPGAGRKPDPAIAARNICIVQRYSDGGTLAECALDFDVSIRMVRKVLEAAEVETRPRGGRMIDPVDVDPSAQRARKKRRAEYNKKKLAEWLAIPENLHSRRQYMAAYMAARQRDPAKADMIRRTNIEYRRNLALRRFGAEASVINGDDDDK
ncbi:hypothetical protein [Novosphingobium sp. 17-62-19]|uniref:hypothetical protein n=1 Tax=Novosphingobium sp. 17-62-19 TaxID=1970406 RepID=UPI0025D13D6C|nr:hypothetical protein [Novosphingobium sp. 17-62-19]HQS95073.1 hypothetical protein [Novosphingobium sp.]